MVSYIDSALRDLDWSHWFGINFECEVIDTPDEEHITKVMDRLVDIMADLEEVKAQLS
jgi:hypothetical protein